ncbi:MAG: LuxR C-terminal-related transcriptional regulator, partial [Leeuwenhoekiella sp.]
SIGVALAFRDNIPYLFGWSDPFYYRLELASHILIGVFGGYFAFSFVDLRNKKAPVGKIFIFAFAILSVLSMFCYWLFNEFIYYAIADLLIFLSIVSLWIVSYSVTIKSTQLYWVFGIFAINIYFIFEFLVIYNFGYTILNLSPAAIKIGLLIEMLILSFALLTDWYRTKQQTLALRMELKKRGEEIMLLSQYKREDDTNDAYLENLIENHHLNNMEVKILQMLSNGLSEEQIAQKQHVSTATLKEKIKLLYAKIGIEDKDAMDLI